MYTDRVKNHIQQLKNAGYELRVPGGKNRANVTDPSYACFGVIPRKIKYKKHGQLLTGYDVLLVPYRNKNADPKNCDEEYEEKKFSETHEGTLEREIVEETGVLAKNYERLKSWSLRDNRTTATEDLHEKNAYIVTEYDASNIRHVLSPSQPNIGVPFWVPLTLAIREVWPPHLWILHEASLYLEHLGYRLPLFLKHQEKNTWHHHRV